MISMRHAERGGALVEFAVVAPVMFIFLLGMMQMAYLLYAYHAVSNAARLGARFAVVRGADCVNSSVCPTSSSDVQTFVRTQVPGLDKNSLTATTTWNDPPSTWSNAVTGCDASDQNAGCVVYVTVNYTFKFLGDVPYLPVGKNGMQLTSTSKQVVN